MSVRRDAKGSPPDWVDILLAATIAAWATVMAAIATGAVIVLIGNFRIELLASTLGSLVVAGGIAFFIAIFACAILGLPALALVTLLRLDEGWQAALIGAIAGLIFSGTLMGWPSVVKDWSIVLSTIVFIVAGAVAGVAAWRERRKGRILL